MRPSLQKLRVSIAADADEKRFPGHDHRSERRSG
jgi:hypothetical protein